jgi:hypothetical protein
MSKINGNECMAVAKAIEDNDAKKYAKVWRMFAPDDLPPQKLAARLMETIKLVYPSLEDVGKVDMWGGSESVTHLTNIALAFGKTNEQRWWMVREAFDLMTEAP